MMRAKMAGPTPAISVSGPLNSLPSGLLLHVYASRFGLACTFRPGTTTPALYQPSRHSLQGDCAALPQWLLPRPCAAAAGKPGPARHSPEAWPSETRLGDHGRPHALRRTLDTGSLVGRAGQSWPRQAHSLLLGRARSAAAAGLSTSDGSGLAECCAGSNRYGKLRRLAEAGARDGPGRWPYAGDPVRQFQHAVRYSLPGWPGLGRLPASLASLGCAVDRGGAVRFHGFAVFRQPRRLDRPALYRAGPL